MNETTPINLNVSAEETSIYADGQLFKFSVSDLKDNDIAIQQLINGHNLSQRKIFDLNVELQKSKEEIATFSLQPVLSIALATMNITGVVLVGFGVNYLSGDKPPAASVILLAIGVILSVFSALGGIPKITNFLKGKKHAN